MQVVNRLRGRLIAFAAAVVVAGGLMVPSAAFADVSIDGTTLNQGENTVGGGTATLSESVLDMVNVVAEKMQADEDLTINFNGGNEIETVSVKDSATVEMNFSGENDVEHFEAAGDADLTINANGHNDFDDVTVGEDAKLTINVTGENDFDYIEARDNASVTIQGTSCQKRDIVNIVGEDGKNYIYAEKGDIKIDHVTINLEDEEAAVESREGNITIDTSKIGKGDDNEFAEIVAGKALKIFESVIDIKGTVYSGGQMTIEHSDVKVAKPDSKFEPTKYRVYSETGIELIREKNGEVKKGSFLDEDVWYVDTDDNDGDDVDLEADGKPAYYKCSDDDDDDDSTKGMPKTGDDTSPLLPMGVASGAVVLVLATRRRVFDR